jgi:hypothetical protein
VRSTTWLVLCLAAALGCRTQRLGRDQGVRAIFEAQARRDAAPPASATADDAAAINAKHHEALAPAATPAPGAAAPANLYPQPLVGP